MWAISTLSTKPGHHSLVVSARSVRPSATLAAPPDRGTGGAAGAGMNSPTLVVTERVPRKYESRSTASTPSSSAQATVASTSASDEDQNECCGTTGGKLGVAYVPL